MPVPFWGDDPDAWNRLGIGSTVEFVFDKTSVTIEGDLGNDWDVKKSPGADGAKATNRGYDPCRPKVVWTLYTAEHFATYQALLEDVQPRPSKQAPVVIEVSHPDLDLHKKRRFRIAKIHLLKKLGPEQKQAQFDLIEYFPEPKKIPKKASTSAEDEERDSEIRRRNQGRHLELEEYRPSKTSLKP